VFLADKEMGKIMKDNFVIVKLDVNENGDKVSLENPGGRAVMKDLNGEQSGLPFMAILDAKGKKLVDTNRDGTQKSNIGYPARPEEIEHFMKMLKTAPRLSDADRTRIETWLKEHAPKG
jgi:hypothetical protein